jgi:hypothetical protein
MSDYTPDLVDPHDPNKILDTGKPSNAFSQAAAAFAEVINPAQEQLLKAVADTIELDGQFIAMLDRAGQSYAQTDRAAKFPEPPAQSSVGPPSTGS